MPAAPLALNVSCDALRAVAHAISEEETRYYLRGIHVEPCKRGGVLVVATDGHRLCAVRDEKGGATRAAILQARWTDPLLQTKRSESDARRLILAEGARARVAIEGVAARDAGEIAVTEIDGVFPDWKRLVPADALGKSPKGTVSFNTDYLGDLGRSARIVAGLRPSDHIALSFHQASPSDPLMALCPAAPEALWVVMPVRAEAPRLPAWANALPRTRKLAPVTPA